jgi:hypothetical protein
MAKSDVTNKPKTSKKGSKKTCLGCGKGYKETGCHRHGNFCGYCSPECFNKTGG